jgi:hypothetical protein
LTAAEDDRQAGLVSLLGKLKSLFGGGGAYVATPLGWTVAKVVKDGALRGVVRIRADRPGLPPATRFATSVSVSWTYGQDGLPGDAHTRAMNRFEAALDELTDDNGHACLMRVRTGFGAREWLFYTRDSAHFMARFNALLAGHEAYPIEIVFAEDPEWRDWEASKAGLVAAPRQ